MTVTRNVTPLKRQWQTLNNARAERGLMRYSYTYLAEIASSAEAIPGDPVAVSKSVIAALMSGTYAAATAPVIINRLEHCIRVKLADLGIVEANKAKRKPAPKKPRNLRQVKRVSPQGYVKVGRQTYYLGSAFAGTIATIDPHGDKDRTITAVARVSYDPEITAKRTARPIDPANNQLGYEAPR